MCVDIAGIVKIGSEKGTNRISGTQTNIRFSVPIALPGIPNGNKPVKVCSTRLMGDGMSTF